ncbi:MAG TPA: hypothetical protein VM553_18830 [Dongiaceae bacterium]|nr:hypothetical protein [Dongiaceae bacterium]
MLNGHLETKGNYRIEEWPERPFSLSAFRIHGRPRQLSDKRWWVRGVLFNNPGRTVVDACFEDLNQNAVELHGRSQEYLRHESRKTLAAIRKDLEQIKKNPLLISAARIRACRDLLHTLNEFCWYGKHADARALNSEILDYMAQYYQPAQRVTRRAG